MNPITFSRLVTPLKQRTISSPTHLRVFSGLLMPDDSYTRVVDRQRSMLKKRHLMLWERSNVLANEIANHGTQQRLLLIQQQQDEEEYDDLLLEMDQIKHKLSQLDQLETLEREIME